MFAFVTSDRFARLDSKDRDRLEALAKLDEFSVGQQISASGTPMEWLYLIASGGVDLRAKTHSGEVTLCELGPGDIFGEMESFCELPPGVRHVARKETIVRAVPKNPLKQELKAHRSLASGLLTVYCRSISEKLRATNEVAVRMGSGGGASHPPPPAAPGSPRASHLSYEEAAWLALLGQRMVVAAGEIVVSEGESSRAFYVVEHGELEVRKGKVGQPEQTLARLGERDLFGFMSFVDGKPRSASVVSLGESQLARIEPDALDKALHLNFTVSFKFLGTICGVLGRTYRETAQKIITSS